mgnify:CR=1 FL=1
MIKKILLGLGGTPYTTVAIQRAVELARRFDAEITGVTVLDLERLTKVGLAQEETIAVAGGYDRAGQQRRASAGKAGPRGNRFAHHPKRRPAVVFVPMIRAR